MKRLNLTISILLIMAPCLSMVAVASAQDSSKVKTHDGFYLRLSLGGQFAAFFRGVEAEDRVYGYEEDSAVIGGGLTSEITLGGTPLPGLVLGGSIFLGNVIDPEIKSEDFPDRDLDGDLQFSMWGFTVDYYIDQYSGFHLGGTVGGTVVGARLPEESLFDFIGGWGLGAVVTTGYDWWISSQWSLGILGRLIYAGVIGEGTEDGIDAEEQSNYLSIGLSFTAVYH